MKIEGFEMSIIDTAIILAAGRGSRLKELSLEQPKPMTEVNNTAIIDNLIRQLIDNKIVKFPSNKTEEAIRRSVKLLNHKDFKNYNIIDLRIHGKIVAE